MEFEENGHVYVRTYKRVWRFERYFYSFDRFKLPRPITWWQLWYFIISVLVIFLVDKSTFLLDWLGSSLLKYLALPSLAAYYLSRIKYDGKTPHKWMYSLIRFYFTPKYFSRYQPVERSGRIRILGMPQFRERYEIEVSDKEKKKKRRKKA
ncbi:MULTISPECIES: TcpE family conjugal transfer membrane protein [Bacillota]|uniref:TcpE family conjugal transfer membrane protein n=1 Tax=Bacillota TaxID=1239 RepID=UPI0039F096C3